jgi:uncharacterized protein YcfJ
MLAGSITATTASAGSTLGTPNSASTTVQARVVSSTPVVAQVAVPREMCFDEMRVQEATPSGAGALIGAVAGAAVGNAVGKGSGRAVATGVGLIGGAILGNHIENRGRPGEMQTVRRCEQQSSYENQVVAYSVVYEINGQRYTTQMPSEPGATMPVQMTVFPVHPVSATPYVRYVSTVVSHPAPVVVVDRRGTQKWHHDRYRHAYPAHYSKRNVRSEERHGRPHWH